MKNRTQFIIVVLIFGIVTMLLFGIKKPPEKLNENELVEKYKLLERTGEFGAGTIYKLIGSQMVHK